MGRGAMGLSVLGALVAVGCGVDDVQCLGERAPRCQDDRHVESCDRYAMLVVRECVGSTICVEQNGTAACVVTPMEACTDVLSTRCGADDVEECHPVGYWAPAPDPCPAGRVCVDADMLGAACAPEGYDSCSNVYENRCNGETPELCTEWRYWEPGEACVDGNVCQVLDGLAVCAIDPPETCAGGDFECRDGSVVACGGGYKYWYERCTDGTTCQVDGDGVHCG
jgi:hypothetical protein